jgi:hypothetical protein
MSHSRRNHPLEGSEARNRQEQGGGGKIPQTPASPFAWQRPMIVRPREKRLCFVVPPDFRFSREGNRIGGWRYTLDLREGKSPG